MIEAQADVVLGEAFAPAAKAHARIYRGGIAGVLLPALVFAAGIVGGSTIDMWLAGRSPAYAAWSGLFSLAGLFVGLMLALRLYSKRHMAGFLAGLREMGSPPDFPTRFRFDPDGITIDNQRISYRIAWPAVLFVMPVESHWLIQADTVTIAVPHRAFADAGDEQAFLDLAKTSLNAEAADRSAFARQSH